MESVAGTLLMMTDDNRKPETIAPPPQAATVKLTLEELTAVTDHVNRKAVSPNDACLVCASPLNSVLDDVYKVDVIPVGSPFSPTAQPLLSTVCLNCGFIRFFNRLVVDKLIQEYSASLNVAPLLEGEDGG